MNTEMTQAALQQLPADLQQVVVRLQALPESERRSYLASLSPETRRRLIAAMFTPRAGQIAWAGGKGAAVGGVVGYIWKGKPALGALVGAGTGVTLHLGIRCILRQIFAWGLEQAVTARPRE
jgi:hypothetical protein